jgi:stage V sporulation protein B
MSPAAASTTIGIFIAAYNIARVPAFVLTTITTVMLPSISRAISMNDEPLARRHIDRSLRFGFILYLPVCLVFMAQPEKLLQWIYSKDFSGGGLILSFLVVGEGLHVIHAILGTSLIAAGEARKAAVVVIASLIPAIGMLILFVSNWGAAGAAFSNLLIILISAAILSILARRRFNTLMNKRSVCNILLASFLMFLVFFLLSRTGLNILVPCTAGLVAYFMVLIATREITRQDVAAFLPWMRVQPSRAI